MSDFKSAEQKLQQKIWSVLSGSVLPNDDAKLFAERVAMKAKKVGLTEDLLFVLEYHEATYLTMGSSDSDRARDAMTLLLRTQAKMEKDEEIP